GRGHRRERPGDGLVVGGVVHQFDDLVGPARAAADADGEQGDLVLPADVADQAAQVAADVAALRPVVAAVLGVLDDAVAAVGDVQRIDAGDGGVAVEEDVAEGVVVGGVAGDTREQGGGCAAGGRRRAARRDGVDALVAAAVRRGVQLQLGVAVQGEDVHDPRVVDRAADVDGGGRGGVVEGHVAGAARARAPRAGGPDLVAVGAGGAADVAAAVAVADARVGDDAARTADRGHDAGGGIRGRGGRVTGAGVG